MKRRLLLIMLLASLIGFADAAYLAWTESLGIAPTCYLNTGCDIVAASPWARILDIPVAVYGAFFYANIAGFIIWGLTSRVRVRLYLRVLASLGFLMSLYFFFLQAFVIRAWCEYCLLSFAMSITLFSLSWFLKGEMVQSLNATESGGDSTGLHTT